MSFTEHRISASSRGEVGDQDIGVQEKKEEIKKVSRGVCLKVVEVEARPPPRP